MPIYEYECGKCQEAFEFSQKISEPALAACPKCGSPVRKLVSRSSFQLKGGGWYATDYKKSSAPSSSPATTPKDPATPAAAETPKAPEKPKGDGGCGGGGCGHKH